MLPIRDENPTQGTAWMTILLVVANVLVSVWQWVLPEAAAEQLVYSAGFIPARMTHVAELGGLPPLLTLFTSQFLHGGLLHLGGNMLFLWIFGNNVEEQMGGVRFLTFYLLCGVLAGLVHYASAPASTVPAVGASGAISGVLRGARSSARDPHAHRSRFYITVVPIPTIQSASGCHQIVEAREHECGRGVAWFAHIGGSSR
jgi:membrane associated rhomboid family serine protease